ncbi:DUF6790 family protein [Paenibacillus lycopersici]|uniref:DUF6790 family protein n=1 Tax=Paenibacillus lycopersici TaxID=2704462 RepID=UPI00139182DC|nr:DUF6790 family protein [Paenibacillus lycopersici]
MKYFYLYVVLAFMLILPVASIGIELAGRESVAFDMSLIGKWFLFWAVGVRLFTAGLRQALNPSFTAEAIFHIKNAEAHPIVRELGFANLCIGLGGVLSLWHPDWRMAVALIGGLYFALAALLHIVKRPVSANETIALVSDWWITLLMDAYLIYHYQ